MPSKAITDRAAPGPGPGGDWRRGDEEAPSLMREDQPTFARTVALLGAMLIIIVGVGLYYNRFATAWASFWIAVGLAGMLFHAAFDADVQIRRLYGLLAGLGLAVGVGMTLWSFWHTGAYLLHGLIAMTLALAFGLGFLRNETDLDIRKVAGFVVLGTGGVLAVVGLLGGTLKGSFLLPTGLLLALVGLMYLAAFVRTHGISDDLGYYAGLGIGGVGLLFFLIALVRSLMPFLFSVGWDAYYFMPAGLLLMGLGLLYGAVSLLLCSDATLVVLTRRELGAFFFSPVAYLVLLGFIIGCWLAFVQFFSLIVRATNERSGVFEPIVQYYMFSLIPVLVNLFIPSVLTMRLLSEEKRSGTLEVLLTAPVNEPAVVLSKFLAGWVLFLTIWVPFGLYLLAIPMAGGNVFDYKPLISFYVALAVSGAAFISVGLFFSSLTGNQIVSAVFTFVAMLGFTACYLVRDMFPGDSPWRSVFLHMSYLNWWLNALEGQLDPKPLLFFLSVTVFFLFATVKVLEARKWK
jgi:ABC-2 type transport system permease protein